MGELPLLAADGVEIDLPSRHGNVTTPVGAAVFQAFLGRGYDGRAQRFARPALPLECRWKHRSKPRPDQEHCRDCNQRVRCLVHAGVFSVKPIIQGPSRRCPSRRSGSSSDLRSRIPRRSDSRVAQPHRAGELGRASRSTALQRPGANTPQTAETSFLGR